MLTVQSLVDELGLVARRRRGGRRVRRSAGCTSRELLDPTPWLSGGELLLTTGIQLRDRRAAARRSCAGWSTTTSPGLGFGTGFEHDADPDGARRRGRAARLPAVRGALRDAVHRDHREGVRATRQRAVRGAAARHRGPPAARAAGARGARARGGRARARGRDRRRGRGARRQRRGDGVRELPPRAAAPRRSRRSAREVARRATRRAAPVTFEPAHDDVVGPRARAAGRGRTPRAARRPGSSPSATPAASGEFERLILQQAVTVVALELMRRRVVRDTERRLAGDILAEAVAGELDEHELRGRLRPFGVGDERRGAGVRARRPARAPRPTLERRCSEAGVRRARRTPRAAAVRGRRRRSRATRSRSPARARDALARASTARCAPRPAGRAGCERCSAQLPRGPLRARGRGARERPRARGRLLARPRRVPVPALGAGRRGAALYCDSVLGPIENGEGEYGGELLRSLEAFLEQNGQWERPRASSTATATRCATGSGASSS